MGRRCGGSGALVRSVEPTAVRTYVRRAAVAGGARAEVLLSDEPEIQAGVCEFLRRNRGVRGFIFTGASALGALLRYV